MGSLTVFALMEATNTTRVLEHLNELRKFGATGGGKRGLGVSRQALTPPDIAAREWVMTKMADAGLARRRMDGIGTVYGEGGDPSAPSLLMGSHTDSQPEGGWLDGALGVVYALEAARVLHEVGAPGAWSVIDFQDEEGRYNTLTGSRVFARHLPPPLEEMADGRARAGLSAAPLLYWDSARPAGFSGYLEAHIEQGPRLEAANASLGVVTAVVGLRQMRVFFLGRQDHAGGCEMPERADAALAAMRYASGLDAALRRVCDAPKACDGAVWTFPDLTGFVSHSTIPGEANLTLQFRAPTEAPMEEIERLARSHCEADRSALGLPPLSHARPVRCTIVHERPPVRAAPMDDEMRSCVEAAARLAALSAGAGAAGTLSMPSRAVHDASPVATRMPAAMLFVPSVGGVSHSFDEHTHDKDLAVGARAFVGAAAGIVLQECAATPPELGRVSAVIPA